MGASSAKALLYVLALIMVTSDGSRGVAAEDGTLMSGDRRACAEQSGSACPKDNSTMEHEETYNGKKIRIRTDRSPEGVWQATAEIESQASLAPLAAPGTYASEQEARSAAFSAAAAEVDRSRAGVGKP